MNSTTAPPGGDMRASGFDVTRRPRRTWHGEHRNEPTITSAKLASGIGTAVPVLRILDEALYIRIRRDQLVIDPFANVIRFCQVVDR